MSRVLLDTDLRTVASIREDIDAGRIALADFQRDFDWSERDARALLATMLMGWPAGSVLFLTGERSHVGSRGFVDGPATVPHPPQIVLDGQQRLTTAYHALTDRGRVVHAIKLSSALASDVEEVEDGMHSFARRVWDERHRGSPWIGDELFIPMYVLKDADSFFDFRDVAVATRPAAKSVDPDSLLQRVWRERLGRLSEYVFPVVLIEPAPKADVDDAAVARIFERINRTGQRLGAFDLVVARASPDANLRELWDEARLSDAVIDRWLGDDGLGEDGMPLLQAISLRQPSHDVRQAAVLDLAPDLIRSSWDPALEATSRAIRFLSSVCGVVSSDWLPYRAILVTLTAFAMERDPLEHRDLLSRWFWSRSFGLRFDVAANTRTGDEFVLLAAAAEHTNLLPVEPVRYSLLARATRRRYPAIFRALLCLLVTRDASDVSGTSLGLREAARQNGQLSEDVVVASVLRREPESDLHLRAMAMVLAARPTARVLRREGLKGLLPVSPGALRSQFLPAPMAEGTTWLSERAQLVADFLRLDMGLDVVRDHDPP